MLFVVRVVGGRSDRVGAGFGEGEGAGQRLGLVADAGEDAVGADGGDAGDRGCAAGVGTGVEDRQAGGGLGAVGKTAVLAVGVVAGGAGQVGGRIGAARCGGQGLVSGVAEVGGDDVVAVAVAVPRWSAVPRMEPVMVFFSQAKSPPGVSSTGNGAVVAG